MPDREKSIEEAEEDLRPKGSPFVEAMRELAKPGAGLEKVLRGVVTVDD